MSNNERKSCKQTVTCLSSTKKSYLRHRKLCKKTLGSKRQRLYSTITSVFRFRKGLKTRYITYHYLKSLICWVRNTPRFRDGLGEGPVPSKEGNRCRDYQSLTKEYKSTLNKKTLKVSKEDQDGNLLLKMNF